MKKKVLLLMVAVAMICGSLQAQAPYKHSIGGIVGSLNGVSYKTFVMDKFAIGVDLGVQITRTAGERFRNVDMYSLMLNPNFMYQGHFTAGLYGYVGGGVSLGYNWYSDIWRHYDYYGRGWYSDLGKFGVNAIMGLEYKFNIPLALSLDFRPGYGLLFDADRFTWNHFDWNLSASVRYAF